MLPSMKITLPIILLVMVQLAVAGVYKWTDSTGRVHYSDRPVSGVETLEMALPGRSQPEQGQEGEEAVPALYEEVEIVAPEEDQTIRSDNGALNLSIVIRPPLTDDHRIQVLIDGAPIAGTIDSPQSSVNGVSYGSHSIQVKLVDYQEQPVATSNTVNFHLRKPLPQAATVE